MKEADGWRASPEADVGTTISRWSTTVMSAWFHFSELAEASRLWARSDSARWKRRAVIIEKYNSYVENQNDPDRHGSPAGAIDLKRLKRSDRWTSSGRKLRRTATMGGVVINNLAAPER
ncbi:MAG: hypothetical protein ACLVJ6_10550 [Merdibacter sp.]